MEKYYKYVQQREFVAKQICQLSKLCIAINCTKYHKSDTLCECIEKGLPNTQILAFYFIALCEREPNTQSFNVPIGHI